MCKRSPCPLAFLALVVALNITSCPGDSTPTPTPTPSPTPFPDPTEIGRLEDQPSSAGLAALFDTSGSFPASLSNCWKIWGHHNALITQGFGADPSVMVYKDRVYVVASNDALLYKNNAAAQTNDPYEDSIQGMRLLSSADLANWTDHGLINVGSLPVWTANPIYPMPAPVASFETRSWAPSMVWKNIGGKDKFFIYYANSGNGIGVITSDSPTGPWTSPLNKLLIDRDTPNCGDVANLFDPGVLVDDDGSAYMYFGGGGNGADSGMGRRVELGADMISIKGTPETWTAPNLFEDSEIAKINDMYYYSYCNNQGYEICYMTNVDPLGAFKNPKGIMKSPQSQLGTSDENNHHCIFRFKNKVYIAYHASTVARAMGLLRYRSTHIDAVPIDNKGAISAITMTKKGVEQVGNFDPYALNEAETIGIQGGVYTRPDTDAGNGMLVTSIDTGDWLALYGVDFGETGASKITVRVRMPEDTDYVGAIELRLNPEGDGETGDNGTLLASNTARITGGTVIGRIRLKAKPGEEGKYAAITAALDETVTGVNDLVFVFYSSRGVKAETINPDSRHKNGFEFDRWQFER